MLVVDNEALTLSGENFDLTREHSDYFELVQIIYNFEGHGDPVKHILLVTALIAVRLEPPSELNFSHTRSGKQRRLSF